MEGIVTVYDETEDYKAMFQEEGGYLFVHMEFYNWTPSVYKEIVEKADGMFEAIKERGHTLAFTYSKEKKFKKLWNKIKPLEEQTTFENEGVVYYFGAWDLED